MGAILLGIAAKSIAVLAAAWIFAIAARKQSAAARHLIWTAAATALLLLPFFSLSLPAIHFAAADRVLAPAAIFTAQASAHSQQITPAAFPRPGASPVRATPWRPDWATVLAFVWALGAMLGFARLSIAWNAMRRLRSHSNAADAPELAALCETLGIHRPVDVLEAATAAMPMTFGWLHPVVFLPADAVEWSAGRRRAVLLHELAHVRRGDIATQLIARVAFSLYWWNPLCWTAWREFLKLRERAADDLVLAAGTRASDYAVHLLDVARLKIPAREAAAIAMVHRSQLEARLAAILDSSTRRNAPGRFAVALAAIAAVIAIAPVAAIRAQDDSLPADVDATIRAATGQKNFEMLDRAAAGFVKIHQYATAKTLLEASLKVRADAAGERSDIYSDGLIKLGDLAWDHGRFLKMRAKDYYEQAVAHGDRPVAARALMRLGILSLRPPQSRTGQPDSSQAEGYLQRAISVNSGGQISGEALAWMGVIRAWQGNSAEAQSFFDRAVGAAKEALIAEMYWWYKQTQEKSMAGSADALAPGARNFRAEHIAELSSRVAGASSAQKIGGDVHPPAVASKMDPEYSQEARALKIAGTVVLRLVVGADGTPGNFTLVKGLGYGLDERALDAVSQWKFKPGT